MTKSPAPRRRRWRRVAAWMGLGVAGLSGVLLVRAAILRPEPFDPGPAPELPEVDPGAAAKALGRALAIPTISPDGSPARTEAMLALHRLLERDYPRVHATLEREVVGELSLLYRWRGTEPSLPPVLLLAHMDVVPVEPGTEADWGLPPFSGEVVGGEIWGRGAMDDKTAVVGLLWAAEALLESGFVPRRTLVIALGHDEEIGGRNGAVAIASRLEQRGERFAFLLDEGGAIVQDAIPGLEPPAAMVGVAEKGYATLRLSLRDEGGHSSMPPPTGAIGRLSAAVQRLQDEPMPKQIRGATALMLDHLAPHMSFGARIGLANRWLLDPVLAGVMSTEPPANASVRTTIVPTMFDAGVAANVLAARGEVVLNARILPGDTVQDVIDHVQRVIDDPEIEVRCAAEADCWEPSAVADVEGEGFAIVRRAIAHVFPDAVVIPNLVVGATDARHYARVTDDAFRFLPIRMRNEERVRLHGTGERVSVDGFSDSVRFYMTLMTLAGG